MIQVGGTFGDRVDLLDRFVSVVNILPDSWRRRLAIENDEVHYSPIDVLNASERIGLPAVLACFSRRPKSTLNSEDRRAVRQCFETWKHEDGPAIVHLGGSRRGRAGSNPRVDWVDPRDLASLLGLTPVGISFDCLLEADQGDRAIIEVRERMLLR